MSMIAFCKVNERLSSSERASLDGDCRPAGNVISSRKILIAILSGCSFRKYREMIYFACRVVGSGPCLSSVSTAIGLPPFTA